MSPKGGIARQFHTLIPGRCLRNGTPCRDGGAMGDPSQQEVRA